MAKTEQEIHDISDIPWKQVMPKVLEKVLNYDPETGNISRLLKFEPGYESDEVLTHEFFEEIYVLSGTLIDKTKKLTLKAGNYGYRHPGMKHGPYSAPAGAMTFEIRNFTG